MYNDAVMAVIVKVVAAIFRDRVGDWDMLKRAKSPCGELKTGFVNGV